MKIEKGDKLVFVGHKDYARYNEIIGEICTVVDDYLIHSCTLAWENPNKEVSFSPFYRELGMSRTWNRKWIEEKGAFEHLQQDSKFSLEFELD